MSAPAPDGPGDAPVEAGGVSVRVLGADLQAARDAVLAAAVREGWASSLSEGDASLWGPDAQEEAARRLGWLDLHESSRPLVGRLRELRRELAEEGLDRVVLCGMGGSSLAPEVICATAGVELTVLDTTDAGQVRAASTDRLDRTVVVVSSKSGGTTETRAQEAVLREALVASGLSQEEASRRFVAVTDPGSGLEEDATRGGWRAVVLADPSVGGRYSALTAFGLVPSALAGVDVEALLDEAAALRPALAGDTDNPGLALGAVLGGAATGAGGTDPRLAVVLAEAGSGIDGFGDWAEQLLAESTGKEGRGLLPVVVEGTDAPGAEADAPGAHLVLLTAGTGSAGQGGDAFGARGATEVAGPLGAQLLAWEYATAIVGRALEINPFDQPNVQESKDNTSRLLEETGGAAPEDPEPAFSDGPVQVFGDASLLSGTSDLAGALDALLGSVPDDGYLAVMAYLDRQTDGDVAGLRSVLASRTGRPVTFGWGPRFLHSTGQLHKGGPPTGAFLQVTGAVDADVDVPGQPFTLASLQAAQAAGDVQALAGRDRPVVRVHLTDREAGRAALLAAARGAA